MKAFIADNIRNKGVGISYFQGRKRLYSQDFVATNEYLANNPDFVAGVLGTFLTTVSDDLDVRSSNVEITDQFHTNRSTSEVTALWHTQVLSTTVTSSSTKNRTVNVAFDTSVQSVITIENLLEKEEEYIDFASVEFRIDGQLQSSQSYYINQGRALFQADLSALAASIYTITLTYTVVELSLNVNLDRGVFGAIVSKFQNNEYVVRLLYSNETAGIITYQTEGETNTELVAMHLLYSQVSPSLVVNGTFSYAVADRIYFPSSREYQVFAVRPKNVNSSTIFNVESPKGYSVREPWYLRLSGRGTSSVPIKELPESNFYAVDRKESARVVNRRQLTISGRNISVRTEGDTVKGILVYADGFRDNPIDVASYVPIGGIVTLKNDVPLQAKVNVEYREFIQEVDYRFYQLNPRLNNDPLELVNNYLFIYINPDSTDASRSVYHLIIPRITTTEIKEYTYADLLDILVDNGIPNGIPVTLVNIIEPVDEDYYNVYDTRDKGGYSGPYKAVVDKTLWDGEDVDISGVLIAKVPVIIEQQLEAKMIEWENLDRDFKIRRRERINEVMSDYKRLGMKLYVEYEEE